MKKIIVCISLLISVLAFSTSASMVFAMSPSTDVAALDFAVMNDRQTYFAQNQNFIVDSNKPAGDKYNPFAINNFNDLVRLSNEVNILSNNFESTFFVLTADIEEKIATLYSIGDYISNDNNSKAFSGTFYGNNKKISVNITPTQNRSSAGLFGYVSKHGIISDLNVSGKIIGKGLNVGGVAGYNSGLIENCKFDGILENINSNVGGVAGYNDGIVSKCKTTITMSLTGAARSIGGIVGNNWGEVIDSKSSGTIHVQKDKGGAFESRDIGGIVGVSYDGSLVEKCENDIEINANHENVGGIAGRLYKATLTNCINNGNIFQNGQNEKNFWGLIVGYSFKSSISNVINSGTSQKLPNLLFGFIDTYPKNCYNYNTHKMVDATNIENSDAIFYKAFEGLDFETIFGYEVDFSIPSIRAYNKTYKTNKVFTVSIDDIEYTGANIILNKEDFVYRDILHSDVNIVTLFFEGQETSNVLEIGKYVARLAYLGSSSQNANYYDASFFVTVSQIDKIKISTPIKKTQYYINEEINLNNGLIDIVKEDKSEIKNIAITPSMISGFDSSSIGAKTITITINSAKTTFEIVVKNDNLTKLLLVLPQKYEYQLNEEMDLTGMSVIGIYESGKEECISLDKLKIDNFSTLTLGYKLVNVEYKGIKSSFVIVVKDKLILNKSFIADKSIKVKKGETINLNLLSLTYFYGNGDIENIQLTNNMLHNFDSSIIGQQIVTLKYNEDSYQFLVEVFEDSPDVPIDKNNSSCSQPNSVIFLLPLCLFFIKGRKVSI